MAKRGQGVIVFHCVVFWCIVGVSVVACVGLMEVRMADTLTTLIEGLGSTSHEIAQALENKGIRGRKNSMTSCPIAEYIKQEYGKELVMVTRRDMVLSEEGKPTTIVPIPFPAKTFIRNFDDGAYPDLELRSQPEDIPSL